MAKLTVIEVDNKYGLYITVEGKVLFNIIPTHTMDEIVNILKEKYNPDMEITCPNKILKLAGIKEKKGRPMIGDLYLPKLKVSNQLSDNMIAEAKSLGITVPQLRRMAYEELLYNH